MRRICSSALCALFIMALGAPAALADAVTSPAGPAGSATYTGDPGENDEVTVTTVDADTISFSTTGDTITETGDCVEIDADTSECDASEAVVNGQDGVDDVDASALTSQRITLNGGSGDDTLTGGEQNDTVNGESGEDELTGDDGEDTLNGGSNPDTLTGSDGNDRLNGEDGEDNLIGDAGDDDMDGGAGDDRFMFFIDDDYGADEIIGGTGVDRVVQLAFDIAPVPGAANVSYSLNGAADDGPPGQGTNVHTDVEDVTDGLTEFQENSSFVFTYYTGPPLAVPEGEVTLRGSDVDNFLMGGTMADDIDGLLGNDHLIGGDGDDTLRSVDGFHDRLKCGPGHDTAEADSLDTVSESCENVTRADAGNANDVPEDLPPAVAFTAPPPGALTTGVTPLAATATDDRGVVSVQFVDDDTVVCTDVTAPYTCDYQPRGEDVGRNTLSVVATDTAQQTATARRVFSVPRFAPVGISLSLTPRRDARMPIRFTSRGTVTLPPQVTPALGCVGSFVAIQVKAGGNTISNRRVPLTANCTYRSRVTFRSRRRFRTRRSLRVVAVYAGNSVLTTARSARRTVRIR